MPMSRVFILVSVICFLLAFVGTGFNLNSGHLYGHLGWNDMIGVRDRRSDARPCCQGL